MLILCFLLIFFSIFALILGLMPVDNRPKLKLDLKGETVFEPEKKQPRKSFGLMLFGVVRRLAVFNKPFTKTAVGERIFKDLSLAQVPLSPEDFLLVKQLLIAGLILLAMKFNPDPAFFLFSVLMSVAAGYILPEFWLKARVSKIKESILKNLPDTVDLLGLCVNAGLDFMMALKYVVEKSQPSAIVDELKNMMQEINVGKTRRDALRDLAKKYDMPDVSTFSRTLIQADRMGTSVSEALNILAEDMRETRYRRGEAMALKAPMKMLAPLLFCIFPVVAILVAGPIFLDFMHNSPVTKIGH